MWLAEDADTPRCSLPARSTRDATRRTAAHVLGTRRHDEAPPRTAAMCSDCMPVENSVCDGLFALSTTVVYFSELEILQHECVQAIVAQLGRLLMIPHVREPGEVVGVL